MAVIRPPNQFPPRAPVQPASPATAQPAAPRRRLRIPKDRVAPLLSFLVWFLIIFFTVTWSYFGPQEVDPSYNSMAANPLSRMIKLALLGISAVIIIQRQALAKSLFRHVNIFFRIFMLLALFSYAWSISPADTLARFVSMLTVFAVCMAFCLGGWHPERFQNVMRPLITLLLVASVIFGTMYPELGIETGEGTLKNSWRGLTAQKNSFGQLATFGVIFWLHGGLSGRISFLKSLAGTALGFYCVLLSRSSTSLMGCLFVMMLLFLALRSPPALRRYMPYIVTAMVVLVLTYAMAVLNLIPGTGILLEPIAQITGKDMTFSNRSEIWRIIKEHIALAPILGSGYGAYWIGAVPWSPSYRFVGEMYFYPTESHNGYLEIVNDLGYVGLIVLGGFLVTYVRQALRLLKVNRSQATLYLAMFFQQAVVNLSESAWLAINAGFVFLITTSAVVALARTLLEHERAGQLPAAAGNQAARTRLTPQRTGPR